ADVPGRPKAYGAGPSAEPLRSKSSFVTAMIPTELWLICALVFGAVLLGFQGIYWVMFKERREKQAINRRLALTAELANPKEVFLREECNSTKHLAGDRKSTRLNSSH